MKLSEIMPQDLLLISYYIERIWSQFLLCIKWGGRELHSACRESWDWIVVIMLVNFFMYLPHCRKSQDLYNGQITKDALLKSEMQSTKLLLILRDTPSVINQGISQGRMGAASWAEHGCVCPKRRCVKREWNKCVRVVIVCPDWSPLNHRKDLEVG